MVLKRKVYPLLQRLVTFQVSKSSMDSDICSQSGDVYLDSSLSPHKICWCKSVSGPVSSGVKLIFGLYSYTGSPQIFSGYNCLYRPSSATRGWSTAQTLQTSSSPHQLLPEKFASLMGQLGLALPSVIPFLFSRQHTTKTKIWCLYLIGPSH